jgi:hypothetical protein
MTIRRGGRSGRCAGRPAPDPGVSLVAKFRHWLALRPVRVGLLVSVLGVALLNYVDRSPKSIQANGTLDQCFGGWPVVYLEGDWQGALPADIRKNPPGYLPVAVWPAGMSYDEDAGELRDSGGTVRFRRGDRVRINGAVIEVHGDPSPCYYIWNLRIDTIDPASTAGVR